MPFDVAGAVSDAVSGIGSWMTDPLAAFFHRQQTTLDPWSSDIFFTGTGQQPAAFRPSPAPAGGEAVPTPAGAWEKFYHPSIQEESSRKAFIQSARNQIGDPYVFGAEGPNSFDCSGLVYFALTKAGVLVPRLTAEGYRQKFPHVSREQLRPGDLVTYSYPGNSQGIPAGQASHINIYLGNGKVVSADHAGAPVRVEEADWAHFLTGLRVGSLNGPTGPKRGRMANRVVRATQGAAMGAASPVREASPYLALQDPSEVQKNLTLANAVQGSLVAGIPQPQQQPQGKAGKAPAGLPQGNWSPDQQRIMSYIMRVAQKQGVPPMLALAFAREESGFSQGAVSPAGAIGVMQLMPGTAAGLGVDPNNMRENVQGGVSYIKSLFQRFGTWNAAITAYNVGPGGYEAGARNAQYLQNVNHWWDVFRMGG